MKLEMFAPMVAMVAITAVVWVLLYVNRIGEMHKRGFDVEDFKGPNSIKTQLERVDASDNFSNLFEVPVLFLALCLAVAVSGLTSPLFVTGAWVYVGLRALHSLIHVSYNRILHRFLVYALSTICLYALWAVFAVRLYAAA